MFEVSWDDPTKETVGQRKNRKENEHISRSSGQQSRASTSSDSVSLKPKNRPSLLTLLNSNKKTFAPPAARVKSSAPGNPSLKEAFHESISAKGSVETKEPTSNLILDRYIVTEYPHPHGLLTQCTSDEPTATFTSWASHSSSSSSSSPWSSSSDLARTGNSSLREDWRRSGRSSVFIQPLSPTSFVTRRTEVSVETRRVGENGVRNAGMGMPMGIDGEVASTVVRIYADDGGREEVRGMYARLSPSAFASSPPLSPPLESPSPPLSRPSTASTSDFTLHDPPAISTSSNRSRSTLRLEATSTRSSSKPRLVLIDPETEFPPHHVRHHKRSTARRSSSRGRSSNSHSQRKDRSPNMSLKPTVSPNPDSSGSLSPNVWKAPENWECSSSGVDDKEGGGSEGDNVPPPIVPPKSAARLLRKSVANMKGEVDARAAVEGRRLSR